MSGTLVVGTSHCRGAEVPRLLPYRDRRTHFVVSNDKKEDRFGNKKTLLPIANLSIIFAYTKTHVPVECI